MSASSIAHCWVKSTILPAAMSASVVSEHGEYVQGFETLSSEVDQVLSMLRNATLGRESSLCEGDERAREGVSNWLDAEDTEDAILDTADMITLTQSAEADETE